MKPALHFLKYYLFVILSIFTDVGPADATTFLAGMGRSGTTWAVDLINYRKDHRLMFEPFIAARVPEAFCFKTHHYIRPDTVDPLLEKQARLILSGNVKNSWVDSGNTKKLFYHKRIIKEIRCNLMLGWLKKLFPDMPLILLVRHPLAIAHSWESLKMLKEDPMAQDRTDFELITSQRELLDDFPIIGDALKGINKSSIFETILFIWCVLYYVPIKQFKLGDIYILAYEDLVLNPEPTLARLFNYLGVKFNWDKIRPLLGTPSITNFLHRDFSEEDKVLFSWKSSYKEEELRRADYILELFGLESVYDPDGLPSKNLQVILSS